MTVFSFWVNIVDMISVYTLKNWYFEKIKEKYRVWGNISGNDNFQDGQWVHTSFITKLEVGWGALHIYTENSEYLAKYAEHDELDKRVLRRALRDFWWPNDVTVFNKIEQSEQRKKEKQKKADDPDAYRNCAILTFSSDILNHFVSLELRQGKKIYKRVDYDIQRGMFEDAFVLSDPKMDYAFRFFPFGKNAYQFDEWKGKFTPVFIRNIGQEPFYASTVYGDFVISPNSTVLISVRKSEERMNTTLDDDTITDKTNVLSHASIHMK